MLLITVCLAASADELPQRAADQQPESVSPTDGHQRMVTLLQEVAKQTSKDSIFLGQQRLQSLRQRAEALAPDADPEEQLALQVELGMEEFRFGTAVAAVQHLDRAYLLLTSQEEPPDPITAGKVAYYLGLAHLRKGERQNCVDRHTSDSCILPIRGGGVHVDKEGARQAMRYFRLVVANTPATTKEHVAARWLFNLAAMAAGDYPDGTPGEVRIDPVVFTSEVDFPRFRNIASHLGLDTFDLAGGAIADDFNGDGLLDLLTSTWNPEGSMHFFARRSDGSFADQSQQANLSGITGGLNMMQADYDNDGDLDVLVLRGAWLREAGRHPNSLLRNDGRGRFTDVTFESGLGEEHFPTQTAAWADYDNDGDLDLYIGNETHPGVSYPCQLFRNDGGGRFTDVAGETGVENLRYAKGVAWGDFDNDRFPDLFVSNFYGENRLYRNQGDGSFKDLAPALGVLKPIESFPTWFWDFDNDGALDLLANSYPNASGPSRLFMVAASYLDLPNPAEPPRLYRGDGRGGFTEIAADRGLTRITMPMGANFGDLDNDGYLDFYLGTGYPAYDGLMPNVLFWNQQGARFVDVTFASGLGHLQKGHGIAFADFDQDGDQDVFEQMGGFYPEDDYANALFENPGFGNQWLKIRLVGTRSNRFGIGARLELRFKDRGRARSVFRHVTSGGSFGANPLTQHVGIGQAQRIDELEVYWPTSDSTQTFRDIAVAQLIEITEGETAYRALPHSPLPWR